MPHKLRRVIVINVVAAKTGQPSSLIAELDVRGKVLAVGVNGVGKTTLLRTIPLFYGATPKEILKGTHRGSMIAYTLPAASSAIVYEYERTSDDDLRCAVMYRRPNEDEAVFYIMRSGYEERFFVDDSDEFVDGATFKARAEAAGVWVSQALRMNQYRSVILRERPMTKDGAKLRELALEHSLGPKALYNLGPIAAAISTEKINFDDLRRIVVDRVSEDAAGGGSDGMLAQKPIRDEVKRWLDTREHMAAILARKPDAEKLKEKATQLRTRHMELCTLHVAVKKTIQQCQRREEALRAEMSELKETAVEREGELRGQITAVGGALSNLRTQSEELERDIQRVRGQHEHFRRINIEELVELQGRKPILDQQLRSVTEQLAQLADTARNARERSEARIRDIDASQQQILISLGERRLAAQQDTTNALEALRQEEIRAREQLHAPAQLKELTDSLPQMQREQGRLEEMVRSPQASLETQQLLDQAEKAATAAEQEMTKKASAEEVARRSVSESQKHAAEAARLLQTIDDTIAKAHERLEQLQTQLTPADGSLLAFLRTHEESAWIDAARVLAPELIRRTDLEPELTDVGIAPGRIEVGSLSLETALLPIPSWVNETELKQEITLQEAALQALRDKFGEAQAAARTKAQALESANNDLAVAQAQLGLARTALNDARSQRDSLREKVREERRRAAAEANLMLQELLIQIAEVQGQIDDLTQGVAERIRKLGEEFAIRRQAIKATLEGAIKQADEEKSAISASSNEEKAKVQAEFERELKGHGIDPATINRQEKLRDEIRAHLERLSQGQGDLKVWATFQTNDLPKLPEMERQHEQLESDITERSTQEKTLKDSLQDFLEGVRVKQEELSRQHAEEGNGMQALVNLRETTSLKDFVDHVAPVEDDFHPEALRSKATQALSMLNNESTDVQTQCRSLRNELLRHDDQIADWLRQKERELPDAQIVQAHEYERLKAMLVCQWFEPSEHGQLLAQLNKQKAAIFMAAGGFVDALRAFDRNIDAFNRKLKKALTQIPKFHSIGELDVNIRSGVGKLAYLKVLEAIRDRSRALTGTVVSLVADDRELPSAEDTSLMREYRSILQPDGGYSVNLREQVELECSLRENNNHHVVRSASEFAAISSTGLTALITSLFLMGFVQMIRDGESVPEITWPSDEIARLDAKNVASFLKALGDSGINVVCAAPNADPTLAIHFDRISSFESDGSVVSAQISGVAA